MDDDTKPDPQPNPSSDPEPKPDPEPRSDPEPRHDPDPSPRPEGTPEWAEAMMRRMESLESLVDSLKPAPDSKPAGRPWLDWGSRR